MTESPTPLTGEELDGLARIAAQIQVERLIIEASSKRLGRAVDALLSMARGTAK